MAIRVITMAIQVITMAIRAITMRRSSRSRCADLRDHDRAVPAHMTASISRTAAERCRTKPAHRITYVATLFDVEIFAGDEMPERPRRGRPSRSNSTSSTPWAPLASRRSKISIPLSRNADSLWRVTAARMRSGPVITRCVPSSRRRRPCDRGRLIKRTRAARRLLRVYPAPSPDQASGPPLVSPRGTETFGTRGKPEAC